jgi:predicted protein tyrosine phosphatase
MVPIWQRTTICGLRNLTDPAGHSHILSIIDPEWPEPDQFALWDAQRWLLLRFHDDIEPRPDRILPTREHVAQILEFGRGLESDGAARLFIHCLSGKSRSTAAAAMIWALSAPQRNESDVVEDLVRLRPEAWPNSLMIEFADELLGRDGRLVRAIRDYYRRRIADRPELEVSLRRSYRAGEVVR